MRQRLGMLLTALTGAACIAYGTVTHSSILNTPKIKCTVFNQDSIIWTPFSECKLWIAPNIGKEIVWRETFQIIDEYKPNVITVYVHGEGGYIAPTILLWNKLKLSKATVNVVVDGSVNSASAYIALMASRDGTTTIAPGVYFMFHRPVVKDAEGKEYTKEELCASAKGLTDRGQDLHTKCVDRIEFEDFGTDLFVQTVVFPLLTSEEIMKYNQGHNVFIHGEDMQERINNQNN